MDTVHASDFTPVLPTQAEIAALRTVADAARMVLPALKVRGYEGTGLLLKPLVAALDALAALLADAGEVPDSE